eukprot:2919915-Ditylum_brightwellii.AAC.1
MKKRQTVSAKVEISGKKATETKSDKVSKRSGGTQRTKSQRSYKKSKSGPKKQTETICRSEIATDDQNSHVSALSSKGLVSLSCMSEQTSKKKKGKATLLRDNKSEDHSSKSKPTAVTALVTLHVAQLQNVLAAKQDRSTSLVYV